MKNRKKLFIFVGLLVLVVVFLVIYYFPVIFQEGNPTPLIKGIWILNFGGEKIVKLDVAGEEYMTKSRDDVTPLFVQLENGGYEFSEQLGAGYFFISPDGDRLTVMRRYYSRFYSLWKLSLSQ